MGTPEFSIPALRALVENGYSVQAVITQPDRPKGRGRKMRFSPVKEAALGYNLTILQPERVSCPEFCKAIRKMAPDLLVVVAFGQILNQALLSLPAWGVLNIHASLLPKYRGAAPIQWAILNNNTKTGLTAMRMDAGLDTGPILDQAETTIAPDETAGQLHDRLARMSGDFLIKSLKGIQKNRLPPTPQDNSRASYAPKIDRKMARIQWEHSGRAVSALIRAMDPWPGAVTKFGDKEIKMYGPKVVVEGRKTDAPGKVVGCRDQGLEVETKDGMMVIGELQASGKKRMPSREFLRGFPLEIGHILG